MLPVLLFLFGFLNFDYYWFMYKNCAETIETRKITITIPILFYLFKVISKVYVTDLGKGFRDEAVEAIQQVWLNFYVASIYQSHQAFNWNVVKYI